MGLYASNITSVLAQFPSQQIASVIDGWEFVFLTISIALFITVVISFLFGIQNLQFKNVPVK